MPLDKNLREVVYGCILRDTQVPFARQHFGENIRYQDDNATPHHARVVTAYALQEDITKLDQPSISPDCSTIEHLWDEPGHAVNRMDNPTQTLNELRQALLWAEAPVERLQDTPLSDAVRVKYTSPYPAANFDNFC